MISFIKDPYKSLYSVMQEPVLGFILSAISDSVFMVQVSGGVIFSVNET